MRARRLEALAAAVMAASLAVLPGSAWAATTVPAAKTLCDAAVTRRLTSLSTVRTNLDTATNVAGSDRTNLDAELDAAVSGLTNLKGTIDADTTLAKVRSDCKQIVTGFYVYVFLIPKVELVRATDRVDAAAAVLKSLQGLLQGLVNADLAKGKNVTAAQGFVTDLGVKVSAATTSATSAASAVLPLTAAGFPGNRPTIVSALAALKSAAGTLQGAEAAGSNAVRELKALG